MPTEELLEMHRKRGAVDPLSAEGGGERMGALKAGLKSITCAPLPPPAPFRLAHLFTLLLALPSVFAMYYVFSFTLVRGPTASVFAVGTAVLGGVLTLVLFRPLEVLVRVAVAVIMAAKGRGGSSRGGDSSSSGSTQLDTLALTLPALSFPSASAKVATLPVTLATAALAPLSALTAAWFQGEEEDEERSRGNGGNGSSGRGQQQQQRHSSSTLRAALLTSIYSRACEEVDWEGHVKGEGALLQINPSSSAATAKVANEGSLF